MRSIARRCGEFKKKGGSTQMGNLETNDLLAKEVTNK
jgi:hypothetical protein